MPRKAQIKRFVDTVKKHYKKHGRDLPWRTSATPYAILVSEIMLQQTQVDRVIPKYRAFIKAFPTPRSLAMARLVDVLRVWQGLGYNRRAKMLHECAKRICAVHGGRIPRSYDDLVALPGVGPYTAAAVCAFAYDIPLPLIETNVRTVYLHHFFKGRDSVRDAELMPFIEATLDRKHPRIWYWALMDYGAHIKRHVGNESRRSASHTRQSRFEGSSRQVRGAIIRALSLRASLSAVALQKKLG